MVFTGKTVAGLNNPTVVVLTKLLRQNASIDWDIKESLQAQLRVVIKRTLRKYGYPPDMQ